MSTYHAWITVLMASCEGAVINGLVKKGYAVSAANGNTLTITSKDNPSAVIALRVEKENIESGKVIYEDLMYILTNIEARYYSIVISEYSQQSVWCGSNIVLPQLIENKTVDKKLN